MNSAMENPAVRQSLGLVDCTKPLCDDLQKKIETLYTDEEIRNFCEVLLTGCGDSYVAGLAVQPAFEALSGMRVKALSTTELCFHYPLPSGDYGPALAVGVSISGKAADTAAAMQAVKNAGGWTLGVTESRTTALAQTADRILKHDSMEAELAPGTKTYFTSLLSLLLLAVHFGVARGHITADGAAAVRADIEGYTEAFRPVIPALTEQCMALAELLKDCRHFETVGSGTDYATAAFVREKIYEAVGKVTAVENTEDWLHVNYYARRPAEIGTLLFAAGDSPAKSRYLEAAWAMDFIGRPYVVVTDLDAGEFPPSAKVITLPKAPRLWLTPLMQFMPMTMLFGFMQELLGEKPLRGLEGVWGGKNAIYADQSGILDYFKEKGDESRV